MFVITSYYGQFFIVKTLAVPHIYIYKPPVSTHLLFPTLNSETDGRVEFLLFAASIEQVKA